MKIKPGCGCLVLLLGLMNFAFMLVMAYSAFVGTNNVCPSCGFEWVKKGGVISYLLVLFFIANIVTCGMVAWQALRERAMKRFMPALESQGQAEMNDMEGEEPEEPQDDE